MKTIKITLTDAEYAEIMRKANLVHSKCQVFAGHEKPLTRAKTIVTMWAKLNLIRNANYFSQGMEVR